MKSLRWLPFLALAFLVNAGIFFVVPFASAVLVAPAKQDYKTGQTAVQVDVVTRARPPEKQHKEIRQIVAQQAKSFKPSRALAGPARTIQMDLSLATGGAGGGGVGVAMGGGGSGVGGVGGGSGGLGAEVFDPSEVDQEARVIKDAQPNYPARARKEGVNGYVKLYLVIDTRGLVVDVQVLSVDPQGYGFEIEAQKALRQFRFEPAKLRDMPVAQKATKEFVFDLGY